MTQLEREAEEYAIKQPMDGFDTQMRRDTFTRYSLQESFIAGAKSKYVQKEKIKAQIEYITNEMDSINWDIRKIYVEELQQQLKELEQ